MALSVAWLRAPRNGVGVSCSGESGFGSKANGQHLISTGMPTPVSGPGAAIPRVLKPILVMRKARVKTCFRVPVVHAIGVLIAVILRERDKGGDGLGLGAQVPIQPPPKD